MPLQFPRWKIDVTVGGQRVKTIYEIATTAKAAISKAKHKLRGAVSNAGAFKFTATKADEDHATKKYSTRASEKIGRTMHEWKRGKLKSGSGGKVTSRKQAIAIGLSQARRRGYKVPSSPLSRHATMSLDAKVRAYLGNLGAAQEIDARGIARAIGGVDPLEADYALERAARDGFAITSDGRWFGPTGVKHVTHARKKKSAAELSRDIALVALKQERDQLLRALGYAGNTPAQVANYHDRIEGIDAKIRALR